MHGSKVKGKICEVARRLDNLTVQKCAVEEKIGRVLQQIDNVSENIQYAGQELEEAAVKKLMKEARSETLSDLEEIKRKMAESENELSTYDQKLEKAYNKLCRFYQGQCI